MALVSKNLEIDREALGWVCSEGRTILRLAIFNPNDVADRGEKGTASFLLRGEGAGSWQWLFPYAFGKTEEGSEGNIARGIEDYWSRGFLSVTTIADLPWVYLQDGVPVELHVEHLTEAAKTSVLALMSLYDEGYMVALYTEISNE